MIISHLLTRDCLPLLIQDHLPSTYSGLFLPPAHSLRIVSLYLFMIVSLYLLSIISPYLLRIVSPTYPLGASLAVAGKVPAEE